MKAKGYFLTDWLLTALLTTGSLLCLTTGFDLQVQWLPLGVVLISSVCLSCLCWPGKQSPWLLLAAGVLFFGYGLETDLPESAANLFLLVGKLYRSAYGWDIGTLFLDTPASIFRADVTTICAFLGFFLSLGLGWCLCRRKNLWITLVFSVSLLVPTLVAQDTVPGEFAIFLLLLGLILLLLSHGVRRREASQGARLTWMLLLPSVLVVAGLLLAVPQSTYTPPDLSQGILAFLFGQDVGGGTDIPVFEGGERINLNQIGPKSQSNVLAMNVTVDYSGSIYIRGTTYTTYTGLRWTDADNAETEDFRVNDLYYREEAGTMAISTARTHDFQYLPYYPQGGRELVYGRLENPERQQDYSFRVSRLRWDWKNLWAQEHPGVTMGTVSYGDDPMLQLPESTLEAVQKYLRQARIGRDLTPIQAADRIAQFVARSAKYDIRTGRMPSGEADFARWFLEDAQTGYCVHFATAATVLLRAAGIPARYVEGYLTNALDNPLTAVSGSRLPVTQRMAHAWVEYLVPDVGWVILEPTPSAEEPEPPEPTTTPTGPTTQPSGSTAPTVLPTLPSAPTGTSSSSSATTRPGTQPGGSGQGGSGFTIPGEVWIGLGWSVGILALLLIQWRLRLWLHRRLLRRGERRRQALRHWRYAQYLASLCGEPVPAQLLELTYRAKFSQHPTTGEDLAVYDRYFAACAQKLGKKGLLWQLYYRLLLAIY